MNKKGFTLPEIIAVIVILGILVAIGTPVYFAISNNVKNNQLSSKLEYLRAQAIKYAEDNTLDASKVITVGNLVYDGYVVADKYVKEDGVEIPFVVNPADKSENLACRVINISVEDDDYTAKVTESKNCDLMNEDSFVPEMGIAVYNYDNDKLKAEIKNFKEDNKEWFNTDIAVVINPKFDDIISTRITHQGKTIEVNKNNMLTDPQVGLKISQTYSNVVVVTATSILKDEIHISVQTKDSVKNAVIKINIDKEEPRIKSSTYSGWTQKDGKHAKVYVGDGNGSGAKYVYLTATNVLTTELYNRFDVIDEVATINHGYIINEGVDTPLSNGIYYLWAEDAVGNITSTPYELEISNSDAVAPTCEIRNYNNVWKDETRKIVYACVDNESGCSVDNSGYVKDVNYSTKKQSMEQTKIVDNTGNETICPDRIVDAYVDIDKPTIESITIESADTRFKTNNTTVKVKASDEHSGLKSVCVMIGNKELSNCNWINIDDSYIDTIHNEGPISYTFSIPKTIGTYDRKDPKSYQVYVYVKDMVGKVSDIKSTSYATYTYCDAQEVEEYGTYGGCNASCGPGNRSRKNKMKDLYFGDHSCGLKTQTTPCTGDDCGSDEGGGGGSCSIGPSGNMYTGVPDYGCFCNGEWNGSYGPGDVGNSATC